MKNIIVYDFAWQKKIFGLSKTKILIFYLDTTSTTLKHTAIAKMKKKIQKVVLIVKWHNL